MPYYKICTVCGAYLDCGERCDCQDKETAPSAANTESGKVKVIDQTTFTSHFNE